MNYLNCCLKVQSLYKISYSVRHLQVCKYLNLLSLNGLQRMFSASTNVLGHNLTQNLNRYIENSASIPVFQSLTAVTCFCPNVRPWVTSLQTFMNQKSILGSSAPWPGSLHSLPQARKSTGLKQQHGRWDAVPHLAAMPAQHVP